MTKSKRKFEPAKSNMMPMIDCIFLLLVFFMVATKFKKEENNIKISHVEGRGGGRGLHEPIVIEFDEAGNLMLNKGRVSIEELPEELGKRLKGRKENDRTVRIDGRRTSYGKVMRVIDICQKEKTTNILFECRNFR